MVGAQDLDDAGLAAAVAVSSLGEVAVGEVVDVADVSKCNTVAVLADDLSNIVVGVCVQAAGAQGQAVVLVVHHAQEAVDALSIHQQAGQAEDIPRGIVHVDGHLDVALAAGGHQSFQEVLQVLPQLKMGLAAPAMVADSAVMINNMLDSLPYKIFATSSIDAMVHSVESFLSPNGCSISRIFSTEALKTILTCWKKSVEAGGEDAWKTYAADFLKASNWAGLGFGYAGCAAVHACAYPLGSVYHIPHGQSNQLMFKDVMKMYKKIKPTGRINDLEAVIAESLSVAPENALEELYALMDKVLKSAPLEEFGVKKSDLSIFAGDVIKTQQRLLRNNYVQLSEEQILEIYEAAY